MNKGKVHIFPVRKALVDGKWKKSPMTKGHWGEYHATEEEFKAQSNYGMVIPDGVVVIDLDLQKGVTRKKVESVLGVTLNWEDALIQSTVSGGQHYAFSIPAGAFLKQGNDLLDVAGFDTRCSSRGWICGGDGYTDESLSGLPDALLYDPLPELPNEAIEKLSDDFDGMDGLDDLELAVAAENIVEGLTIDDARLYLSKLPDGDCNSYQPWLNVGFALSHQFGGSIDGFNLWDEFSRQSNFYDFDELRQKWKNFTKSRHKKPITFASIIARAGGKHVVKIDRFEGIRVLAAAIQDLGQYEKFKKQMVKTPLTDIGADLRSMLAQDIFTGFGKENGLTKAEIKKSIMPQKMKVVDQDGIEQQPEWLRNWVYIEKLCAFANIEKGYHIKKEAFDAKYSREIECITAGKPASAIALIDHPILSIVDEMYWPGQERTFELEKILMLNSYRPSGVKPCSVLDADGQAVVDMFLAHIDYLIEEPRERGILLDWMAYLVQNPGKKINWAILLQGGVGCGKSYLSKLLSFILGDNYKNLDPSTLSERFTGWATGAIVIAIEEIRMNGVNRFQVLDRIKPFITNSTIAIEQKGIDHKTVPNFTSYFMLTNYKDALPIIDGDRRYCVIFSPIQTEDDINRELGGEVAAKDYFTRLFDDSERRADAIAHYLLNRKISDEFSANGRAPLTNAKSEMCELAVSPERDQIEDYIAQHHCAVINDSVLDITRLNDMVRVEGDTMPGARATTAILSEMGYKRIKTKRIFISRSDEKKNHYVWFKGIKNDDAVRIVKRFYNTTDDVFSEDDSDVPF